MGDAAVVRFYFFGFFVRLIFQFVLIEKIVLGW